MFNNVEDRGLRCRAEQRTRNRHSTQGRLNFQIRVFKPLSTRPKLSAQPQRGSFGRSNFDVNDFLTVAPVRRFIMATVLYHCACLSLSPAPPPPHLQSSSFSFHQLSELYFCEECDAVRCNRCVSVEVSGYYCPNCLFEVPSASVRAEKNRSSLPPRTYKRANSHDVN